MMRRLLTGLALSIPTAALAHQDLGVATGVLAAAAHPFTGVDHLLALVAVGLVASRLPLRAGLAFVASAAVLLPAGALLAGGIPVAAIEAGILASVVAFGLLLSAGPRLAAWSAVPAAGLLLCHGAAHALEGAPGLPAVLGFALGSLSLVATGLGLGLALRLDRGDARRRWLGGGLVAAGLSLAVGA